MALSFVRLLENIYSPQCCRFYPLPVTSEVRLKSDTAVVLSASFCVIQYSGCDHEVLGSGMPRVEQGNQIRWLAQSVLQLWMYIGV